VFHFVCRLTFRSDILRKGHYLLAGWRISQRIGQVNTQAQGFFMF
jgi:hypothetical protein